MPDLKKKINSFGIVLMHWQFNEQDVNKKFYIKENKLKKVSTIIAIINREKKQLPQHPPVIMKVKDKRKRKHNDGKTASDYLISYPKREKKKKKKGIKGG